MTQSNDYKIFSTFIDPKNPEISFESEACLLKNGNCKMSERSRVKMSSNKTFNNLTSDLFVVVTQF